MVDSANNKCYITYRTKGGGGLKAGMKKTDTAFITMSCFI